MKKNLIRTDHTIYSTEEDKMIPITDEQIRTASYIHQQVLLGVFVSAMAIRKIFDDKLYYALGCQSKEEYCDNMLPMSRMNAHRYYVIASKFDSVAKQLSNNDLEPISLSNGSANVTTLLQTGGEKLEELGISKLYELTKIDDDDLGELIKNGSARINGEEITLDELKDMTFKEASKLIKKATQKYKEEIKSLSGKLATAQEDIKLLNSEMDLITEENKTAKKIEQRFGPEANKLKNKIDSINEARQLLNEFNEVLLRAGVTLDDPISIQTDLTDLIRKIEGCYNTMLNQYDDIIAAAV